MKEVKNRDKNKNVVVNDSVPRNASIEEIEFDIVIAAGLGEVAAASNGSTAEESAPPAVPPPRQPPPRVGMCPIRWQRCWRRRLSPQHNLPLCSRPRRSRQRRRPVLRSRHQRRDRCASVVTLLVTMNK